ncbi:T9SS type A sorting domain-containing protein [Psychroserpens sp.]|uniref:T9SS type A sorting domain-containing protein n=1 Tax=Psychroserpens sp. TaxID=2020870 RepID=UPI002B26DB8C|nr:T9SS type A sorting domain-containing protein [Psychroserpens sp.]
MKSPNFQFHLFGSTNSVFKLVFLFLCLLTFTTSFAQPAFPTAYGGGAYATGGRGGNVYHVTNLLDDGSVGSFRWAIAQPRPATIVFDVSGTIDCTNYMIIQGQDLTIAGQTAPIGGITFTFSDPNHLFRFWNVENMIVRYIRIRMQRDNNNIGLDVYGNGTEARNLIFDHCSISYAGWTGFGLRGTNSYNNTFQNGIIAECKTGSIFGDVDLNYIDESYDNSFINNFFYNTSHRFCNPNSTAGGSSTGRVDMINNVSQNHRFRLSRAYGEIKLNHINNYYAAGSNTSLSFTKMNQLNGSFNNVEIYTSGNIMDKGLFTDPNADNRLIWAEFNSGNANQNAPLSEFVSTQHPLIGRPLNIKTATEAYNDIINNPTIGASASLNADGSISPNYDANDLAYLAKTAEGEGAYEDYTTGNAGTDRSFFYEQRYFDFLASISSTPVNTRPANYDTNNDGIPEIWFAANVPNGATASDISPSGYSYLELFLNSVDIDNNMTFQVSAGNDVTICDGGSTTLTATGADSYVWSPGNISGNSIDVNPITDTVYTVTGSHSDGSTTTDDVIVTVNPIPNVDAGADVSINYGNSTVLTANGADNYVWNTGETTQSITVNPLIETTYTVTGTTDTCQNTDAVTVFIVGNQVVANAGDDQTICNGSVATLTATGGVAYVWNTGETTASINVSPSNTTTYTVTASDATGTVSDTDDVIVSVNDLPTVDAGVNVSITEGDSTTLTASGATTYLWNTGESTQSITVTPSDDTIFTVTGFQNGCEAIDDVLVNVEPVNIVANAGDDVTICEGETVTLSASGGPTYLWNTGETTSSIDVSPNATTTYSVTVSNSQGTSSDEDQVTVFVNNLPTVDAGVNVSIIEGDSATLTASGANTYLWSTGETTQSITVSPSDNTIYTVTGFLNGCEATDDVLVNVETENVVANAGDDVTICEGETVTLTAIGGSIFLWNTGETTSSIDVTPDGTTTYSVTVSNSQGTSSDEDQVTVFVNDLPTVYAGVNVSIIEGDSTTLTASGANTYLWSTGESTQSITVAPSDNTVYTVTGFLNGCEATDDVLVNVETENVNANAGDDVTICEGETVTLTAIGGTIFLWSTGESTSSIEVAPNTTTTYSVTVTNTLGTSSDEDQVTVFVNDLPTVDAGVNVSITEGDSTMLTATGANTYLWSTGESTQSITVAPTDDTIYTVTGFLNGCEATDDVLVNVETENVVANAGDDVTICEGTTVTLSASGGSTYLWNTGETSASIEVTPNATTNYSVTVFNTLGTSSDEDQVTVFVNDLPTVDAGVNVTITEGDSTMLTATGANTYLWSTGETTQSIIVNPINSTIYTVTGFLNGCEASDDVLVNVEPIVFTASAGDDQSICEGTSATLTASEGDAYLWSTGETTQSIVVSPWATETYTVTVFEGDEQAQDDVVVIVNLNPNVNIVNGGEVTILEGEFITLSANGANTYEWNNGATQPNIAVSPSLSTTYSVTGYINNCSDEKSVTVNVVEAVEAYAGEDLVVCANEMITLTAEGGEFYLWNTGEETQSIEVMPGEDTEYSVLVYNALSSDEATVMVYVNDCEPEEIPIVEQEFNFLIYQDVSADVLKFKISGMDRVDVDQLVIYDLNGRIVYREEIKSNENTQSLDKEINSSQFSRGIYIVRLIYDDTEILKKIPIR